jgi:serine/threonine protein kinase
VTDALPDEGILAGKYRIDRVLGAGAMGTVYAATHVVLGQRVAIKRMHPERLGRKNALERFLREARAAARLRSQHAARVIDVGVLEDGAPFIVMEHLDGEDLAALLDRGGALPSALAVEYVLQAAEAVAEAHAAGIVHRDLKPENLFLIRDPAGAPCIKVLDFGISKILGDELALTRAAVAVGSPLYMSPEQMVSSRDVDSRTDLWSLGVVLYELVTATRPFEAELSNELYGRILHGAPPPISTLVATVPAGLEAVILQCLQKDRARRFPNAAELAAALAPFAPERGATLAARVASVLGVATAPVRATELLDPDPPRSPTIAAMPAAIPERPRAPATKAAARARGSRLAIAAGIAALAAAATIAAFVVLHRPAPIRALPSPAAPILRASTTPGLSAASAPPPRDDAEAPAATRSDRPK